MFSPAMPSPLSSRGPSIAIRMLSALLLMVAGALIYTVVRDQSRRPAIAAAPAVAAPRPVLARGDLAADEHATIELFNSVSPAVVHITSVQLRRSRLSMDVLKIPQGTGSGFIWDEQGHVVTNFHVIQSGQTADVTLSDNSVWKAKIVGTAPDKDLAVLKIDAPPSQLRTIQLGTSSNLLVGQKIFAIGNPFGLDQSLSTGVISGLGREILSVTKRPIQDVIQTDAAINRGNSGGPLLDSAGRLIGVNTAIYSPSGTSSGVGFAVPVDTINRIVPQLIAHGKVVRPGLGIQIGTDQLARRHGIDGVLVMEVPEDSAAGRAGLQGLIPDDNGSWKLQDIIVAVGDEPVHGSADLFRALDRLAVGDSVTLTVQREGRSRQVNVELQALP